MAVCLAIVAAGCGGGADEPQPRVVRGKGYAFEAPRSWALVRTARQVQAAEGGQSLELVAVSRFPLLKRFRPELWPKVTKELDRAAKGLADQQRGTVTASATTDVGGRQARRYDIAFRARGKPLVERIAFVLRGKTEYLLLCRFEQGGDTEPCDRLLRTFRLT